MRENALSDADAMIAALRTGHDSLASLVTGLTDADLAGPSGAAEWDVSQVLSHLGSGAEISRAGLEAAIQGKPNPGSDSWRAIWDRWDAMSRRERADGFIRANEAVTELYESLDAAARADLRVDVGFLPAPVDVATAARFRLSEFALHSWDVRVGFEEHATLAADATAVLAPAAGDMAAWTGKPERLAGRQAVIEVTTTEPALTRALHLGDQISVGSDVPAEPDGTLSLPAEAWVRLIAGRLAPEHTPPAATTTGAADLDLLRQVFPGF
jgi:uncharacterized protein (TIGR03083 family)